MPLSASFPRACYGLVLTVDSFVVRLFNMSAYHREEGHDRGVSQAVHDAYVMGWPCAVRRGKEFIDNNEWNPAAPKDPAGKRPHSPNLEAVYCGRN